MPTVTVATSMFFSEDGRVTKAEWVARWVCAYSDSGEFARYLWEQTSQGADSIGADGNAGPPFGQLLLL